MQPRNQRTEGQDDSAGASLLVRQMGGFQTMGLTVIPGNGARTVEVLSPALPRG